MSLEEHRNNITGLKEGMALAEYNMLREKALRDEKLIMSAPDGTVTEVPAKDEFFRLYGETV